MVLAPALKQAGCDAGQVIAHIDVNNFYVACERVFQPRLTGKAIVVLSNNDACVISRSAEAKRAGVGMGEPWYKVQQRGGDRGVITFSSNYALYADMSNRVMETLARYSDRMEVYSIDEAFLDLQGLPGGDYQRVGEEMVRVIGRETGLPVSIGIAPTKTLAKVATRMAKRGLGVGGAYCMPEEPRRGEILTQLGVEEIWGVGPRIGQRLTEAGFGNAGRLAQIDEAQARKFGTVVLARTVLELRGEVCIALTTVAPAKQMIRSCRGFGRPIQRREEMEAAVLTYTGQVVARLQKQGLVAGRVGVEVSSNPFAAGGAAYARAVRVALREPSEHITEISGAAMAGLDQIFRPGVRYTRAGVWVEELSKQPDSRTEASLSRAGRIDGALAKLREQFPLIALGLGETGLAKKPSWAMRQNQRTPRYTTRFTELAIALA